MIVTLQRDNVVVTGIMKRDKLIMKMNKLVGNFHPIDVTKLLGQVREYLPDCVSYCSCDITTCQ
jgi:hypothetical protein